MFSGRVLAFAPRARAAFAPPRFAPPRLYIAENVCAAGPGGGERLFVCARGRGAEFLYVVLIKFHVLLCLYLTHASTIV